MQQPPAPRSDPLHPRIRHLLPLFAAHLARIPLWQKALLCLAILLGLAGIVAKTQPAQTLTTSGSHPNASSGRAPHSGILDSRDETRTSDDSATPSSTNNAPATPWYGRFGISLVVGFVVGWLLRMFLRLMATILLLIGALLAFLSHYHVIGADLSTRADRQYHQASSWVSSESKLIRDGVIGHVPSTFGGFAGIFMGMRKRR